MHEISDMSDKISYDLSTQTAQLENSTSKLGRIKVELIKGEKKIKKIMLRIKKNQLVLYLVIMMILLMAVFLIFKLFGWENQNNNDLSFLNVFMDDNMIFESLIKIDRIDEIG